MAASPEIANVNQKTQEEVEALKSENDLNIERELRALENLRIEQELGVLKDLQNMHQRALSGYAKGKSEKVIQELDGMFLVALQHQQEQLNLLKTHQGELDEQRRKLEQKRTQRAENVKQSPNTDRLVLSEQLEQEQQQELWRLIEQHKRQLGALKESQREQVLKKRQNQKKGPAEFRPIDATQLEYLIGFVIELHVKIKNAKNAKNAETANLWIHQTIAYFNCLLLQPEIFNVGIQEQLIPVAGLLERLQDEVEKYESTITQALNDFRAIRAMTKEGSTLNHEILGVLQQKFKGLTLNTPSRDTRLNTLYHSCMDYYSSNKLIQRYMFTLLIEKLKKEHSQYMDEINRLIAYDRDYQPILRSASSAVVVRVSEENEQHEGKENVRKMQVEGGNVVGSSNGNANQAFSMLYTLSTQEKFIAGTQIALGSILLLGAFVFAVSAIGTFIPTLGISAVGGFSIGGVMGVAGGTLLLSGLSMFGVFGKSAQNTARTCFDSDLSLFSSP